jgi:hypothetical protein
MRYFYFFIKFRERRCTPKFCTISRDKMKFRKVHDKFASLLWSRLAGLGSKGAAQFLVLESGVEATNC